MTLYLGTVSNFGTFIALSQAKEFVSWSMAKRLRYEVGTTPAAHFHYRKAKRSRENTNDLPEQFTGLSFEVSGKT